MLQASGVPRDLVLAWVGHSNLKTTSRYTHFSEDFKAEVARATGLFSKEDGPYGPNFREMMGSERVM